jgi:hypothetical protein
MPGVEAPPGTKTTRPALLPRPLGDRGGIGSPDWSGDGYERTSAPADALLASDAGAFPAFGSQDVAVAGIGRVDSESRCVYCLRQVEPQPEA